MAGEEKEGKRAKMRLLRGYGYSWLCTSPPKDARRVLSPLWGEQRLASLPGQKKKGGKKEDCSRESSLPSGGAAAGGLSFRLAGARGCGRGELLPRCSCCGVHVTPAAGDGKTGGAQAILGLRTDFSAETLLFWVKRYSARKIHVKLEISIHWF